MNSNFIKFPLSKISKNFYTCIFVSLFSVAALTGCGGGNASTTSTENNLPSPVAGGINGEVLIPGPTGESPVPPSELNVLPTVSVSPRQYADPNVLLNLRGTAVAANGSTIVKTLWTQVTGPEVVIPSPQALENMILVPDANVTTQLEFRLTAQDSEDRINSATVSILVKPVPTFVKVIGGVFYESKGPAIFTVRLNAPSTSPVTISFVTQDGTAKSNTDYVATSGSITMAPGEVLKEIAVPLINDVVDESDESFSLQVTAIDGAAAHANSGVAIIRNGIEPQLSQTIQFTDKGPVTIYSGQQYTNVINPAAPGTGDIIYSSSNSSVANINSQGVVTGTTLGTTTITATKLADDTYLSTTNSYIVQVISRGTAPTVTIEQKDGYSVLLGDTVTLNGYAADVEDGTLPTSNQTSSGTSSVSNSLSNTSSSNASSSVSSSTSGTVPRWSSNISGTLGYGTSLNINTLPMGTHEITYSVTDSDGNTGTAKIHLLVGNLAPLATTSALSTYCTSTDCYSPSKVNDTNLSTLLGNPYSWVNNNLDTTKLPQWVALTWSYGVTINSVDLYTSDGYILRDYDIEYLAGNEWLVAAIVRDNTLTHRSDAIIPTTTSSLRVVAKEGSILQPQHARVNEIVVFGTIPIVREI